MKTPSQLAQKQHNNWICEMCFSVEFILNEINPMANRDYIYHPCPYILVTSLLACSALHVAKSVKLFMSDTDVVSENQSGFLTVWFILPDLFLLKWRYFWWNQNILDKHHVVNSCFLKQTWLNAEAYYFLDDNDKSQEAISVGKYK